MSSSNISYLIDPKYQDVRYSMPIQYYYLIFGGLSILLNLFMVCLFVKFPNLRTIQCNWLIIFACTTHIMIGTTAFMKAVTFLYVLNNERMFDPIFCLFLGLPHFVGYRVGQLVAMLLAFDRLLAIWKPILYVKRQGTVKKAVIVCAMIIFLDSIVFATGLAVGLYTSGYTIPFALSTCFYSSGKTFLYFTPAYSALITAGFFIMYIISLILFAKYITGHKKQKIHTQEHLSKSQRKVYTSVSLVLLCFTIFYAFPLTLQAIKNYTSIANIYLFNFDLLNITSYFINFGSQLNGCLNAIIYLLTHNEFRSCARQIFHKILKKSSIGPFFTHTVSPATSREPDRRVQAF